MLIVRNKAKALISLKKILKPLVYFNIFYIFTASKASDHQCRRIMKGIRPASLEKLPLVGGFLCIANKSRTTFMVDIYAVLRIYSRYAQAKKNNDMRKIFIFILTILLLQSCGSGDEEQLVTIGDKYSLAIPAFLTKVNNLNSDASLQYQHAWKEFYVIAIDESKDELKKALEENNLTESYENNINGYSQLILDVFKESLTNPYQTALIDTTVNGMQAKLTTLTGRVEGIDAFYSIGMYEGKDRFYQVLAWTLKSKQYSYKSKMEKILHSLKELKSTENVQ